MSPIPPGPIDHIGIAVRDLDAACDTYTRILGGRAGERQTVAAQGVELVFIELPGDARVELITPLDDDGAVARFLDRRGEGMHHICIAVADVDDALARLDADGVPLIDREPRIGAQGARIAFVHPRALGGVLLELKEKR